MRVKINTISTGAYRFGYKRLALRHLVRAGEKKKKEEKRKEEKKGKEKKEKEHEKNGRRCARERAHTPGGAPEKCRSAS